MTKQKLKKGKAKGDLPKDLPAWITGDLENADQDDYILCIRRRKWKKNLGYPTNLYHISTCSLHYSFREIFW